MRIPPIHRLVPCLTLVAVLHGATAAAAVESLRYAYVSVQCRPNGAVAAQGCTYYSDVLPVADLGGSGTTLTDAEKRILRQRAVDRFDALGKSCASKLVNVSLGYASRDEAEAQRARFMTNSRTACRESFSAAP